MLEDAIISARPVILGVVGDSAAGKTTITRGLVRLLGEDNVTHVCTDDYHRYDRKQRAEQNITPLDPECNYIDIMAQDLAHLREGDAILKPVYRHQDGTFGPPAYVKPARFTVVEGLLGYHLPEMLNCYRREPDSESFIRPQRRHADIVVSFVPGDSQDPDQLDAHVMLGPGLPHPDLASVVNDEPGGIAMVDQGADRLVVIPGQLDPEAAPAIEEAIWERMHFASHLRSQRLGEFTIGTQLHRSESLALVQLLVLYHLVTAKAAVALGGDGARTPRPNERSR